METQTTPEYIISPMRVQTLPEITFFYVTSPPIPFSDLDKHLDLLLDSLYAAKAQANLGETGTQPADAAQVKILPPYPCASLLLWGSLLHIVEAYEALQKGVQEAGLEHTGECQEWTYFFLGVESPHNLMGITMGIK